MTYSIHHAPVEYKWYATTLYYDVNIGEFVLCNLLISYIFT